MFALIKRWFRLILSLICLVETTACTVPPQRSSTGQGSDIVAFDPVIRSYCKVRFSDIFDRASARLNSIAPDTYCLFDNFGVNRQTVLSVLLKYGEKTSISAVEGREIDSTLHVTQLIDRIAELRRTGSADKSFVGRILIASNDESFVPYEIAQVPIEAVPALVLTLGAFYLAVPAYSKYSADHPEGTDSPTSLTNFQRAIALRKAVIEDALLIVKNDLCKNLNCNIVSVSTSTATPSETSNGSGGSCAAQTAKIEVQVNSMKIAYQDMVTDEHQLYTQARNVNPGGSIAKYGTWDGHVSRYYGLRVGLQRMIAVAQSMGCPVSSEALKWAEMPAPNAPSR